MQRHLMRPPTPYPPSRKKTDIFMICLTSAQPPPLEGEQRTTPNKIRDNPSLNIFSTLFPIFHRPKMALTKYKKKKRI